MTSCNGSISHRRRSPSHNLSSLDHLRCFGCHVFLPELRELLLSTNLPITAWAPCIGCADLLTVPMRHLFFSLRSFRSRDQVTEQTWPVSHLCQALRTFATRFVAYNAYQGLLSRFYTSHHRCHTISSRSRFSLSILSPKPCISSAWPYWGCWGV
jgi:hypothetical protein